MANFSDAVFDYRSSSNGPVWGYPPGSSIVDLVLDDMREVTHAHWKKFPPVNPMWHYLLGTIFILLGITSVTGKYISISNISLC